jgi:hypothetical protein
VGNCISLEKRCNGASDCSDHSDETNCEIIKIDKTLYHKEFPPLSNDDSPTNVTVNVTFHSIGSFNEIENNFAATFTVHLEWYSLR